MAAPDNSVWFPVGHGHEITLSHHWRNEVMTPRERRSSPMTLHNTCMSEAAFYCQVLPPLGVIWSIAKWSYIMGKSHQLLCDPQMGHGGDTVPVEPRAKCSLWGGGLDTKDSLQKKFTCISKVEL